MKLAYMKIQNFRGIKELELDLTDEIGRVRDLVLIVGPNGSGKTSILDAIWFGLQGAIGYGNLRPSFRQEPEFVVMAGEAFAQVEYKITITEEEKTTIEDLQEQVIDKRILEGVPKELDRIGIAILRNRLPVHLTTNVEWTYPSQPGYIEIGSEEGGYHEGDLTTRGALLGKELRRLVNKISASPREYKTDVGSIYFFEQERQVVAAPVSTTPLYIQNDDAIDIRALLIDFGIKDKLGKVSEEKSWYQIVRESYNYICAPRKMGDVYATESAGEYKIEFFDADGTRFGFDGLSSGERSVLNFMVQYLFKRMKNSIVLIDELETHLHPPWQRRLLHALQRMDDGNQFIITTHSPALQEIVRSSSIIELSRLDEIPDWQYAEANEEA